MSIYLQLNIIEDLILMLEKIVDWFIFKTPVHN